MTPVTLYLPMLRFGTEKFPLLLLVAVRDWFVQRSTTSTVAAGCHVSLGWLHYLDGDYASARQEFEIALKLDPERIGAHDNGSQFSCSGGIRWRRVRLALRLLRSSAAGQLRPWQRI